MKQSNLGQTGTNHSASTPGINTPSEQNIQHIFKFSELRHFLRFTNKGLLQNSQSSFGHICPSIYSTFCVP